MSLKRAIGFSACFFLATSSPALAEDPKISLEVRADTTSDTWLAEQVTEVEWLHPLAINCECSEYQALFAAQGKVLLGDSDVSASLFSPFGATNSPEGQCPSFISLQAKVDQINFLGQVEATINEKEQTVTYAGILHEEGVPTESEQLRIQIKDLIGNPSTLCPNTDDEAIDILLTGQSNGSDSGSGTARQTITTYSTRRQRAETRQPVGALARIFHEAKR